MDLDEGATAAVLIQHLSAQYSGLFHNLDTLVVAVNGEYASMSHVLKEGDEVALIPPVSGGRA